MPAYSFDLITRDIPAIIDLSYFCLQRLSKLGKKFSILAKFRLKFFYLDLDFDNL